MKAIGYAGAGDSSVIEWREVAAPALRPGSVRVRVRASGINRADIVQRKGAYPPPPGESDIPGLEVSGEIVEVGEGVQTWRPGDRVMALLASGGYAEEVVVDAGCVLPIPAGWSFAQGASVIEVFVTAHLNLFQLAAVQAGDTALVHAGASGVGTAAIQLLRALGATPLVTVGSADKAALCEQLGAVAILYKEQDFADVVLSRTGGHGVKAILDCIGGSYLERNLKCLAVEGSLVFIGTMGGREAKLDIGRLMVKRQRLIGSTLRALPPARKRDVIARFRAQCWSWLESGAVRPIIDSEFPAREVRAAHERMESNANAGKIVLLW